MTGGPRLCYAVGQKFDQPGSRPGGKEDGEMKKLINTAMVYCLLAAVAGVFYREFTKWNDYTGITTLSKLHTHLFTLGMFLFLILALFARQDSTLVDTKGFRSFFVLYNIALPFLVCTLLARGILEVLQVELTTSMDAMVSGIAGLSHILITIALLLLFSVLRKSAAREQVA